MAPPVQKSDDPENDPYDVLELRFAASAAEVTKAYRKLALKYHPDKQQNDLTTASEQERMAQKFQAIQDARDFLLDPERRRKYDAGRASIEARKLADQAREQQMSAKRRRMKEQLNQQEQEASKQKFNVRPQSEFTKKSQKTSKKVEELRQQGKEMRESFAARQQTEIKETSSTDKAASATTSTLSRNLQDRQIRLKWSRRRMKISPSEHDIARLMTQFGTVEQVEIIGSKANTALITFQSAASCTPCVQAYLKSEEMRASFVGPRKEEEERKQFKMEEEARRNRRPISRHDQESVSDYKLRRAAEREQLLRDMEQGDSADDGTDQPYPKTRENKSQQSKASSSSDGRTHQSEAHFPPDFPATEEFEKCSSPYEKLLLAEKQILSHFKSS
ncbi:hypothetical protein ACA910_005259 [Epithemia clementina (nom. ined.)]